MPTKPTNQPAKAEPLTAIGDYAFGAPGKRERRIPLHIVDDRPQWVKDISARFTELMWAMGKSWDREEIKRMQAESDEILAKLRVYEDEVERQLDAEEMAPNG